ncbi:hypothetical protein MMC07_007382 [Pseudocyphellaria aurata]|nr:hypothetical protein [Pseudocyphellaria aurata]
MGKASKMLADFIDDIPDWKLTDLRSNPRTIHTDDNFRLDMQGMGKASKMLADFIDDIPDWKLTDLRSDPRTIHTDDNFRLDMQGVRKRTYPVEKSETLTDYCIDDNFVQGVQPASEGQ